MKRASYVDNEGNKIDHSFESRKKILYIFILIGTIIPIILIGFIIYTMVENNNCNNIYTEVKDASYKYLKENGDLPAVEGDNITISVEGLYNQRYLNKVKTDNQTCAGEVKVTKYKNKEKSEYIYTLNLTNCNVCSTNTRYKKWGPETPIYNKNKPIVDVIPYYNYRKRQTVVTDWSGKEYEKEELAKKRSAYNIYLPTDLKALKEDVALPNDEEINVLEIQQTEIDYFRYKDKQWRWYDKKGDYSKFSSEKPSGYQKKDEDTKIYTKWMAYSLTHPQEKAYREIKQSEGYLFYYEEKGKKKYANNKQYTVPENVDRNKYNRQEDKSVTMYSYRDAKWRWYNGDKRNYSNPSSTKPQNYEYRDDETITETHYSSWEKEKPKQESYRTIERKATTKFRYLYEILSEPVIKVKNANQGIQKDKFIEKVGMNPDEFNLQEQYKMDVYYKFKYKQR